MEIHSHKATHGGLFVTGINKKSTMNQVMHEQRYRGIFLWLAHPTIDLRLLDYWNLVRAMSQLIDTPYGISANPPLKLIFEFYISHVLIFLYPGKFRCPVPSSSFEPAAYQKEQSWKRKLGLHTWKKAIFLRSLGSLVFFDTTNFVLFDIYPWYVVLILSHQLYQTVII